MKTTIHDVAALAKVSIATVSRVISNPSLVKKETREKVQNVMEKLNYYPSAAARNLSIGVSKKIAVIYPYSPEFIFFKNPFLGATLGGIAEVALKYGYRIILEFDDKNRKHLEKLYYEGHVDGLLITNIKRDDNHIRYLMDKNIPIVLLNQYDEDDSFYVDCDQEKGAFLATSHLINLGHKDIAVLRASLNSIFSLNRLQGYKSALLEAGIKYNKSLIMEDNVEADEITGYNLTKQLLKKGIQFSAIFAFGDPMALGSIRALNEDGFSVPQDISVVGYDDIPLATVMQPSLTTVKQRAKLKGFESATMLINIIEKREIQNKRILIPTELVVRESVKPIK